MKKALKLLPFLLAAAALAAADDAKTPFLPGITITDEHPNGCVDCHRLDASSGKMSVKSGAKNW